MANRWLARQVDRAYLSFPSAAPYFPAGRRLVTGTPMSREISELAPATGPAEDRPLRLLVITGSRGGAFLAERVPHLATIIARVRSIEILQQAGEADASHLRARYASAGVSARVTSVIDDMAAAYRWADLAITRGGAGTLSEVAAAGLPALVVPLSEATEDHQRENAEVFATASGGRVVGEEAWADDELAAYLIDLAGDSERWRQAADRTRRLAVRDAAERIVTDCERMMEGRW